MIKKYALQVSSIGLPYWIEDPVHLRYWTRSGAEREIRTRLTIGFRMGYLHDYRVVNLKEKVSYIKNDRG